ncbi:MAG: oligoendopeptidase F [Treponema sp.]|jgi:oligoendopeptidase F|nr:oligoendopeptidase F [Treponema sp.]
MTASKKTIPLRSEINDENKWDLSSLYTDDTAWEQGLSQYAGETEKIPYYRGTLGSSAEALGDYLDFFRDLGLLGERLAYYSELRETEDEGSDAARAMTGKFAMAYAKKNAALSWAVPEIQAIPDGDMADFLAHPRINEYVVYLNKLLRDKPHILSDKEERILAIHAEGEDTANQAFSVLTNVDMDFGTIETKDGALPLSQSTLIVFLENPDRAIRRNAYKAFYGCFKAHKTTLAALYSGAVKQDVIRARIRNFPSARAAALFPDNVSEAVYDNLVSTVNNNLGFLHRYYGLRKKALKLDELRHYDLHVPLAADVKKTINWEEAVEIVSTALAPLGDEYVSVLRDGLLGRWADRYENKGKRSGAFSAGSYVGDPYILMNYKDDSIRDLFTLAHEGGHSMHSWYSARSNPFMHYDYTIFEAEVASTFNEELLFRYLKNTAGTQALKRFVINKRIDDFLSTLYRQTMFAEFEMRSHDLEEAGTPLTLEVLRGEYRKLLEKYFGPDMHFEEESDLEGLRIPHFYRAFYVYKYATGISASYALALRVLSGGENERRDYYKFLKSGGSRYPIDALKTAGVDISGPAPVEAACKAFGRLVEELENLL